MEICFCRRLPQCASGAWGACVMRASSVGCLTRGCSDTSYLFFGFKYKQHYLAPHITTIKTCTIYHHFFFFSSLSFPLILLDRNEGKKWQGLEMLTPFKLNFKISLTFSQEKKKKTLTGYQN